LTSASFRIDDVNDAPVPHRGRLKVFLGYAAGVGKTYEMLTEAQALRRQGVDVVIGYFEPHGRQDTIALTEGLEMTPTKRWDYRGSSFEEMDTDAVLARRPRMAVVDEFPHTNVPGSARAKRWEDVQVLLDAGIDVLTTMNVQHLESLNDQIWQSTGVRVRETIPDWVLRQADDIVMVDLTPRALMNRLERGVIYPPERARAALRHFFVEPTLVALRELAMRQTAHAVERRHLGDEPVDHLEAPSRPATRERLALLIEPHPASAALIRRGRRVADYLNADTFAVYVSRTRTLDDLDGEQRDALERQLNFARGLQIEARILEGDDVAEALVNFAKVNGVTQIFVLRRRSHALSALWRRGLVQRIVGLAVDMQVTIVADRSSRSGGAPS
jgi:two-component system, OmpR family, sensor histidine kinase KdpD